MFKILVHSVSSTAVKYFWIVLKQLKALLETNPDCQIPIHSPPTPPPKKCLTF